jgi:acylpyruvate hydrolase
MKLATIRDGGSTRAVRIDGDQAVDLGVPDVGEGECAA